jgi:uncharacterized membrane protein
MYIKIRQNIAEIIDWITFGAKCYKNHFYQSIIWGILFASITYTIYQYLLLSPVVDILMPMLAFIVLILGPISALGMFGIAKKYQKKKEKESISIMNHDIDSKEIKSSLMLSVLLSVIMVFYLKGITLIYAFSSSSGFFVPIPGEMTLNYILTNPLMLSLIITWTVVSAWLAFIISWFSYPLIMDKRINPMSAIISSVKSANNHKILLGMWMILVGSLISISLMTPYFIGLVIVTPLIAFSTWAAYEYMIVHVVELRGVEIHNFKAITH